MAHASPRYQMAIGRFHVLKRGIMYLWVGCVWGVCGGVGVCVGCVGGVGGVGGWGALQWGHLTKLL